MKRSRIWRFLAAVSGMLAGGMIVRWLVRMGSSPERAKQNAYHRSSHQAPERPIPANEQARLAGAGTNAHRSLARPLAMPRSGLAWRVVAALLLVLLAFSLLPSACWPSISVGPIAGYDKDTASLVASIVMASGGLWILRRQHHVLPAHGRETTDNVIYLLPALLALAGLAIAEGGVMRGSGIDAFSALPPVAYQPLGALCYATALLVVLRGNNVGQQVSGGPDLGGSQSVGGRMAAAHLVDQLGIVYVSATVVSLYVGRALLVSMYAVLWSALLILLVTIGLIWFRDRWIETRLGILGPRLWTYLAIAAVLNVLVTGGAMVALSWR